MSKTTRPKPPKKNKRLDQSLQKRIAARVNLPVDLDVETGKVASQAGLSQPNFLALCIRYGFLRASNAALALTPKEAV